MGARRKTKKSKIKTWHWYVLFILAILPIITGVFWALSYPSATIDYLSKKIAYEKEHNSLTGLISANPNDIPPQAPTLPIGSILLIAIGISAFFSLRYYYNKIKKK
mgnify:CR=1 FL=1